MTKWPRHYAQEAIEAGDKQAIIDWIGENVPEHLRTLVWSHVKVMVRNRRRKQ